MGAQPKPVYRRQTTDRRTTSGAILRKEVKVDWRFRAACRTEDLEMFFPVGASGPALRQLAGAKSVCRRCPVLLQCRVWALSTGQETGVWGGLSAGERRVMRWSDCTDLPLPHGLHAAPQPSDGAGSPDRAARR
jgi:WhiB family transcriptional regulator, redox-sensing transcriptional regulator